MSLDSVLASGRAAALGRMSSRCTVRRKTGATTTSAAGLVVPVWEDVYTSLPVRVAGTSNGASPSQALTLGSATEVQASRRELHFPHDTTVLRDGDLVEITSGDCAGLVFRVVEADFADQVTARRVAVVATTAPEEWS